MASHPFRPQRNAAISPESGYAGNTRPPRGNSVEYLMELLEKRGHYALLEAVANRQLTPFGAAVEAGIRTRPEATGRGSPNAAKQRAWAAHKATREYERREPAEVEHERPAFAHSELPCFSCSNPCAWAAVKEIADAFVAMKRGVPLPRSYAGILPMSCCRHRRERALVASAMIA
jgi:hypothetical protein